MALKWLIHLFGPARITGHGQTYEKFETVRSAKLLALLAVNPEGKVSRKQVARVLWENEPFDVTRLRLRQELRRLRRSIGEAQEIVIADLENIYLDTHLAVTDVSIVRAFLKLPPEEDEYAVALRNAAGICSEAFLPDWDDEWVLAYRQRAERIQRRVFQAAATEAERTSDHAAASEFAALSAKVRSLDDLLLPLKSELPPQPLASNSPSSLQLRVPSGLDPLHGRKAELEALGDLWNEPAGPRLITLLGPGGIGKTRLAIAFAAQLAAQHRPVGFVFLSKLSNQETIATEILGELGVYGPPSADPIRFLARSLPEEPCMLIFDNAEHLLPRLSHHLAALLEQCPQLRILATSRVSTRLSTEYKFQVRPLDIETDAVDLLVEVANSVRDNTQRPQASDEHFVALARWLEGIPLALKLAGARLRFSTPERLLPQLKSRLELRSAIVDTPDRHRSLFHAFSWSFENLSDASKQVLLAVSLFPSGATFESLSQCVPGLDLYGSAEILVDESLAYVIEEENEVRLRTMRSIGDFVLATFDEAEIADARAAFITAMANLIAAMIPDPLTPITAELLDRIDGDYENLTLAADQALESKHFRLGDIASRLWLYEDPRGKAHAILDRHGRVTASGGILSDEARSRIDLGAGLALYHLDRYSESDALLVASTKMAEKTNQLELAGLARATQYYLASIPSGKPDQVPKQLVSERMAGFGPVARARILARDAGTHYLFQQTQESIAKFTEALRIAQQTGDLPNKCFIAYHLALALGAVKRHAEALEVIRETAEDINRLKGLRFYASYIGMKAWLEYRAGNYEESETVSLEVLDLWHVLQRPNDVAMTNNNLARMYIEMAQLEKSRKRLQTAFLTYEEMGLVRGVVQSLFNLAYFWLESGDSGAAELVLAIGDVYAAEQGLTLQPVEEEFRADLTRRLGPIPAMGAAPSLAEIHDLFFGADPRTLLLAIDPSRPNPTTAMQDGSGTA